MEKKGAPLPLTQGDFCTPHMHRLGLNQLPIRHSVNHQQQQQHPLLCHLPLTGFLAFLLKVFLKKKKNFKSCPDNACCCCSIHVTSYSAHKWEKLISKLHHFPVCCLHFTRSQLLTHEKYTVILKLDNTTVAVTAYTGGIRNWTELNFVRLYERLMIIMKRIHQNMSTTDTVMHDVSYHFIISITGYHNDNRISESM